MLRSLQDLAGFECEATDGPIGTVEDFYFDDRTWHLRVFTVVAGPWLAARKLLIPSRSIDDVHGSERRLTASLTLAQVRAGPDIDSMEPVSRQHEVWRYGYYGYPPADAASKEAFFAAQSEMHRERGDDLDLRSFRAMLRYHIRATDGDIGHLEGMIVDDETWDIRYLIVNTSDWGLGRSVLLATAWVNDVSWLDAIVTVGVEREAVKQAPVYRPGEAIDRSYETRLHEHHAKRAYWSGVD
jgi:hypothetical protein